MPSQRGNSWAVAVKAPDKYHRRSFKTFEEADRWEKYAREQVRLGLPVEEPTVIEREAPTLHSFFEEYGPAIWPYVNFANVEKNQRAITKVFGEDTKMREISGPMIKKKVVAMRKLGWSPSTINTRLSHLRKLLQECKAVGQEVLTTEVPWEQAVTNDRMRFLTVEEETAMVDLMRHWGLDDEARIFETLIDTGCRPSELLKNYNGKEPIKWAEVSKSAGGEAPDVNDPATGQARAVISLLRTKTKKYRVVPLTPRATKNFLVSKQMGDKRPFGDVHTQEMSKLIRMVADHLQLDEVVLYTTRHTCASRLVQRGADLKRVKDWMGHADIKTTLRYAKLTPSDLFSIGDLL